MPGFVSLPELLLLGLIVLLVFGPQRLPELGRQLGRGWREFRDSFSEPDEPDELEDDFDFGLDDAADEDVEDEAYELTSGEEDEPDADETAYEIAAPREHDETGEPKAHS